MAKQVTHPHKRLYQLDDELMSAIEDFRFSRRYKTEAEAVRDLLRLGIKAAQQQKRQAAE